MVRSFVEDNIGRALMRGTCSCSSCRGERERTHLLNINIVSDVGVGVDINASPTPLHNNDKPGYGFSTIRIDTGNQKLRSEGYATVSQLVVVCRVERDGG